MYNFIFNQKINSLKKMKFIIIFSILTLSFVANGFPIPKNDKATFDVIRKNKVIGSVETTFEEIDEKLIVTTTVEIEVKAFFVTVYKFSQLSKETWVKDDFIEFEGHTDFEDEREYFIKGKDDKDKFVATGMDGELILNRNILPLNYWNKDVLKETKVFDTQKGIVRKIKVKKLKDEIIEINNLKINTEKYLLDASKNPKDKGPFPQYTLWYAKNGELIKFKFKNWKDKKEVITQRNNWKN